MKIRNGKKNKIAHKKSTKIDKRTSTFIPDSWVFQTLKLSQSCTHYTNNTSWSPTLILLKIYMIKKVFYPTNYPFTAIWIKKVIYCIHFLTKIYMWLAPKVRSRYLRYGPSLLNRCVFFCTIYLHLVTW